MAEGNGTALLDREVTPEARRFWDDKIANEKDANARAVMAALKRRNFLPQSESGERELTQEEVDKRFENATREEMQREFEKITHGIKEEERKAFTEEDEIDEYIDNMKKELKGESVAPGVVIERKKGDWGGNEDDPVSARIDKIKADWGIYSPEWTTPRIQEVAHKLDDLKLDLSFDQIRTLLEMLVATGKTPQQLLPELEKSKFDDVKNTKEIKAYEDEHGTAPAKLLKLVFFKNLGISETYLQKFLFYKEFRRENERDYDDYPANIEELAWQIIHSPEGTHEVWGVRGKFPLLEMRLEKDEVTGRVTGKYYVNQANMTRWARQRMMYAYDLDPDASQSFFGSVKITKRFPLSLGDMFGSPGNYFKSEDGKTKYDELYNEWIKEAWGMQTLRSWDAEYRKVMGDPKARNELLGKIFNENTMTKRSFNMNLFGLMNTLSLDFEGGKKGDLPDSDNLLGAASNEIYLAYDALSDFDRLRGILGEGSSFFTREGWMSIFTEKVVKEKAEASGEEKVRAFLGSGLSEKFNKAFDKDGRISTIENRDKFIEFINHIWATKVRNGNHELAVREALKMSVAEKYGFMREEPMKDPNGNPIVGSDGEEVMRKKYGLETSDGEEDENSLKMAEVTAWSMVRVFGAAARNDTKCAGYDFATKIGYLQTYRNKSIANGDAAGIKGSKDQFKMLEVDPFRGMVTQAEVIIGYDKGKPIYRNKAPIEVMEEMQQLISAYNLNLRKLERERDSIPDIESNKAQRNAKMAEIRTFKEKMAQAYQDKAGEMEFKQSALSNYFDDHLRVTQQIYDFTLGAEEISMEKYVVSDAVNGVTFNRAEFQKDVQNKLIHPIRYFIKTYPDLNFNMRLRMLDQAATARDGRPVYRVMALGEAMFGHELLNRKEFWLTDTKGKPIEMIDGHGRRMKGIYEIDYDKVQKDKKLLWKQWAATKWATDMAAHRDLHSHDSRFDINYFNNVIKAIESIPADVEGDEFSIRQQIVRKKFFDKKDMKWIKKTAKVENYNLFTRAILKDMLLPDEKEGGIGFFLLLQLMSREIVRREG